MPTAQGGQKMAPRRSDADPGGHGLASESPSVSQYVPDGHCGGSTVPATQYLPIMQSLHRPPLSSQYCPARHATHSAARTAERLVPAHPPHAVLPLPLAARFALQGAHQAWPAALLAVPGSQGAQDSEFTEAYVPGSHTRIAVALAHAAPSEQVVTAQVAPASVVTHKSLNTIE